MRLPSRALANATPSMRLVPTPPRIGPNDGFERMDLFGYRTFGEHLTNIVRTLRGPSVIALDGAWGSGKSVFVRQWAGLLRNTDVRVVLFDAHKHDHDQDAFFAIASEVCAQVRYRPPDKRRALIESVGAVADIIGPVVENVALSLATAGALKLSDLDVPDDGDSPSLWERHLDGVRNYEYAVLRLRNQLGALATGDAPLVVIVDELDRCRPTFALSALYRVKHLFDAEGVCFVLVGDYSQLRRLVADQYGMSKKRAIRYLDKYFHLSLRLPVTCATPSTEKAEFAGSRYFKYLWNKVGLSESTTIGNYYGSETWTPGVHALIEAHGMSLRSVERFVTNLALFYSATRHHGLPMELVVGLGIMRVLDPALYDRARSGRLTDEAVESFLRLSEWKNGDFATRYGERWKRAIAQEPEPVAQGPTELIPGRGRPLVIHGGGGLMATICRYMDQVAQDDRS